MKPMERAAVLGAGTMGAGIAQFLAAKGVEVTLRDIDEEPLEKGLDVIRRQLQRQVDRGRMASSDVDTILSRIHPATDLDCLAPVEWVIEAVVERLSVKQALFQDVEQVVGREAVLATNTSSLSVTAIASVLQNPERFLGLHFFNPAPVMPLVEVVSGERTDPAAANRAVEWLRRLGKTPIQVADTPGFLVNRVARPFHTEPYRLVSTGVADKAQVDRILRSAGFPMGPFELQDLIGIDINLAASEAVYEGFYHDPRFRPHPGQRKMVESGSLGRKVKRGHFTHES
ncbi:3-hydroxyacyl-CoA dehydrogenase family protein [Desmospora profundinema]|uniref:3-hydroxybutyryl-CoA dehydrogenase n=1 Tax=Desmospora profundinema TaxID=1571184 RepID=A0ABU1IPU5_9BACL|nr:3-hydroxyacyl-CoA dehydrogenase NAD-binding domain-containing protein [Desmospora profundinema]MDR6226763.1 3-hydroxybutyryl-CoA dehydrogenase [Desmospora profundinema]